MKILVVNKFYWPKGGSERVMFDLSEAYAAAGHTVVPFAMQSPDNVPTGWEDRFAPAVRYEGVRGLGAARAAVHAVYSRPAKRAIQALLQSEKPDVAHLHNFHHQLSPSIVDALRDAGVPTVFTLHDYKAVCPNYLLYTQGAPCERCLGGRYHHAVVHRCVRGSWGASAVAAVEMTVHRKRRTLERGIARFVSPSRFLARRLEAAGHSPERIRVVPNGVRLGEFEPATGPGEGLLFAGRLSREKGVGTLLKAMERVPDARLTVLGTGPQEAEIRAVARERLGDRVSFPGHVDRGDLLQRVRRARAVVLPSEWYENAPMSALESLASTTPVIAARIGGLPEIVGDGVTGLLFEPGNVRELADAVERLLRHPGHAHEMGRAGRRDVEQRFTLDDQARSMLSILEEVASSASR